MTAFVIRPLSIEDWRDFKQVRLTALANSPGLFSNTLTKEQAYDDTHWQDYFRKEAAVFGLYDGESIAGMSGIYRGTSDGLTDVGYIWGIWISPSCRGRGHSHELTEACIRWAKDRPPIGSLEAGARQSNIASRRILEAAGFSFAGTENHSWPDGERDLICLYRLRLSL